jgi:hypothetical protein
MAKKKGNTVTMTAGDRSVTTSPETLAQAADRIAGGRMTTMATIKSVKIDKDGSQILPDQTIVDISISLIQAELPFEEEPAND